MSVIIPGRIIQTLQAIKDDTASIASKTVADIPGLLKTITPERTENKIMVRAMINTSAEGAFFILDRGGTEIGIGVAAGSRDRVSAAENGFDKGQSVVIEFLDSPATASAVTYKVRWRRRGTSATSYINRNKNDVDNDESYRAISTLTLSEVEG